MATARNYYLGIDLGTTNSVVAWGPIEASSHRVMPEVIKVAMRGASTSQGLVPSVVRYKEGEQIPEEVGLGPKLDLKTPKFGYTIIKSVKLQMGKSHVTGAGWVKPEQVSAHILQSLKFSAEQYLPDNPEVSEVVIGVPACFYPDMKAATVKAAEIAGFKKVQLVVEPQAALLDFIRDQERFAPESRWIDFSEPKVLVIFDLGGGTLDVSMVRAHQITKEEHGRVVTEIHYDELGLSRFTELGGDDFDKLLADFLKEKFFEQTGIRLDDIPDEGNLRTFAYGKLLEYAEAVKQNLTSEVDRLMRNKRLSEEEAMNQAAVDVHIPYLHMTYSLTYHLTYRHYVEIIKPLLGSMALT